MKQRTHILHPSEELSYGMTNKKYNGSENIHLHRVRPVDHFIEAQVDDGDTLQAIALRFHCSISELKRINHIHKDNEIFARRTIKIPVTPYSVLTELIPAQHLEPTTSTSAPDQAPTHIVQGLDNNIENINSNILINSNDNNEIDFALDCNAVVMNSNLAPSLVPYTDGDVSELASEDTQLLPNKDKIPVATVVVKQMTSQGADFGIKWFHLMCCLVVLGVVIPLVYIMFYLDKHEHTDVPPLHSDR